MSAATDNASAEALKEEIMRLKKEKGAVILAHYYQKGEIQDIADYIGDSLALAQKAATIKDAPVVVMCGVSRCGHLHELVQGCRQQ